MGDDLRGIADLEWGVMAGVSLCSEAFDWRRTSNTLNRVDVTVTVNGTFTSGPRPPCGCPYIEEIANLETGASFLKTLSTSGESASGQDDGYFLMWKECCGRFPRPGNFLAGDLFKRATFFNRYTVTEAGPNPCDPGLGCDPPLGYTSDDGGNFIYVSVAGDVGGYRVHISLDSSGDFASYGDVTLLDTVFPTIDSFLGAHEFDLDWNADFGMGSEYSGSHVIGVEFS